MTKNQGQMFPKISPFLIFREYTVKNTPLSPKSWTCKLDHFLHDFQNTDAYPLVCGVGLPGVGRIGGKHKL